MKCQLCIYKHKLFVVKHVAIVSTQLGDGLAEAGSLFLCLHSVEPTAGNIDIR